MANSDAQNFLTLSEFLLGLPLPGVSSLDPDLAQRYYALINSQQPSPPMAQLLSTWAPIQAAGPTVAAVNQQIFGQANLSTLAQQIILLWYDAVWFPSPNQPYSNAAPVPASDYDKALVWTLAQAHPAAVPLSFGYWQYAPQNGSTQKGGQS
jgi:hypothetical protein